MDKTQQNPYPLEGRRPLLSKIWLSIKLIYFTALALAKVYKRIYFKNPSKKPQAVGQEWGQNCLNALNASVQSTGAKPIEGASLIVSNHFSYLDILVQLSQFRAGFVAKKAIASWPLIGPGAAGIGSIFVDRSSKESRLKTKEQIAQKILANNQKIVIFPSGTSSLWGKEWRNGAFEVAKEGKIPVQAVRLSYYPVRECAYVGDDNFFSSFWKMLNFKKIYVEIEVFEKTMIENVDEQRAELNQLVNDSHHAFLKKVNYEDKEVEASKTYKNSYE